MFKDAAHKVGIKRPCSSWGVCRSNVFSDLKWSADVDFPSTSLPQKELDDPLNVWQVGLRKGRSGWEDRGLEPRYRAVRSLQPKNQWDTAGFRYFRAKR